MNTTIYLIGYMASGKTTVGRELAGLLGFAFFDLDELMEEASGKTIHHLFDGPDGIEFRKLEREMLHKTFSFNNAVVACGGGTPCYFDNMEEMKKHGVAIWVCPPLQKMIDRLRSERHTRPLLAKVRDEDLSTFVFNHYQQRIRCYRQAHFPFNTEELTMGELAYFINHNK
jgi:shikimate kinase